VGTRFVACRALASSQTTTASINQRARPSKERFYCTDDAEQVQAALARAHGRRIIEPLERAGLDVDVLLVTYDCRHARNATASRAALVAYVENKAYMAEDFFTQRPIGRGWPNFRAGGGPLAERVWPRSLR